MKNFFFGLFSAYFIFPFLESLSTYISNIFQYNNNKLYKKNCMIKKQIEDIEKENKKQGHSIGFINIQTDLEEDGL